MHLTLVWVVWLVVGVLFLGLLALGAWRLIRATVNHSQALATSQSLVKSLESARHSYAGFPRNDYAKTANAWLASQGLANTPEDDDIPTLDAGPFMAARDNAAVSDTKKAPPRHTVSSTGNAYHDIQIDVLIEQLARNRVQDRLASLVEEEKARLIHDMQLEV
jgi:hypothetical protein